MGRFGSMVEMSGRLTDRPAVARLLRNDLLVLDAIQHVLVERGWGGLSVRAVAETAGLADPTVKARHRDPLGMAIASWRSGRGTDLIAALEDLLEAYGVGERQSAPTDELGAAWLSFVRPSDALHATMELLVTSTFEPRLGEWVAADVGKRLATWCDGGKTPASRRTAARRSAVLARALGFALIARAIDLDARALEGVHVDLAEALRATVPARRIPDVQLVPVLSLTLDENDPASDAAMRAMLDQVARRGFEGTLMTSVFDVSGTSKSFIFHRFGSKQGLLSEAFQRHWSTMVQANFELQARLSKRYDETTTFAAFLKAGMDDGNALGRSLNVERWRLSWHDDDVRRAVRAPVDARIAELATSVGVDAAHGAVVGNLALSEGLTLLPSFAPHLAKLPWITVLAPLIGALERRVLATTSPRSAIADSHDDDDDGDDEHRSRRTTQTPSTR